MKQIAIDALTANIGWIFCNFIVNAATAFAFGAIWIVVSVFGVQEGYINLVTSSPASVCVFLAIIQATTMLFIGIKRWRGGR
jgi:hypothetical protein